MRKSISVFLLLTFIFLVGCNNSKEIINLPDKLELKQEVTDLFDDLNVQNSIINYTKGLVKAYNSRGNGLIEIDSITMNYYKEFSDYIDTQTKNVFKLRLSNEELDLRMQRTEKSLELQEVASLISKSYLDGKLTEEQDKEIKTKIETFIKSYFK